MNKVSIVKCPDYQEDNLKEAFKQVLKPLGGLEKFISPGQKVFLKLNLVIKKQPEAAATTHPAFVAALAEEIIRLGATPILGDSPGGPYNKAFLKGLYQTCGISEAAKKSGAYLNYNTDTVTLPNPEGKILKKITIIKCLQEADVIISLPKLKTHSMTMYTGAVKNLFGAVPGMKKAEYHMAMPKTEDFADLLLDICSFVKPKLSIMDAVTGMEGNGPTAGQPRKIGAILASANPYALDIVAAQLVGFKPEKIVTIKAALERNLCTVCPEIIGKDFPALSIKDFKLPSQYRKINFLENWSLPGWLSRLLIKNLTSRPVFSARKCRKCRACIQHCPPSALTMGKDKPEIDLNLCIRCYCCQELCRYQAVKIRSSLFGG